MSGAGTVGRKAKTRMPKKAPTVLAQQIEMLRALSEIERKAGHTQSTWQIIRDVADRLSKIPDLVGPLERADELFRTALPKFNWGASALTGEAIQLLNEVPGEVRAALIAAKAVS